MRKRQRLAIEELALWVWEPPVRAAGSDESCFLSPDPCPLDWPALFGNSNPVEIEVGMGKGLFLLTEAMARPKVNFFGIEIVRKYQLYAATRLAIRKLPNVKTACCDAKWFLHSCVAEGSVSAVHVLFPDPWWKKRHRKRRVFTPEFAVDVARVLAPGGRLRIASDVEEYFGVMSQIVRSLPGFQEVTGETSRDAVETAGYQTNFERKARLAGTAVWRAVYERSR